MKSRSKSLLAGLLACAAACSQNTPPPEPASFARPTRVAFVCVDKSKTVDAEDYLVPLTKCDTYTPEAISMPVNAGTASYALHALVTQSSRGEVAAVDVVARHVIDNRPDIPGNTFLPTGELPVAIAVAPDDPHTTYVANAGSRDVSVLRTGALFRPQGAESFMKQTVPLHPRDSEMAGVPFDMIMSPEHDALFVSSADAGWLLRIPICLAVSETCKEVGQLDEGGVQRIALEDSWGKLTEDVFAAQPTVDEPYRWTCRTPVQPSPPELLPTRDDPIAMPERGSDVGKPQPAGMALDAFCDRGKCTRRLLVADRRQPIVHAVDLDRLAAGDVSGAVLQPILTGAPTERVVATPRVPVEREGMGQTQYIYAIDARDGSVLVAQDDRIRNVSVDPTNSRADRLDLGVAAAAGSPVAIPLAVLTPDFNVQGPAEQWLTASTSPPEADNPLLCVDPDHQTRNVNRLRGVFLAVGATDGTVRIFTVHDMELKACRSCDSTEVASYTQPYKPGYDPYPVVRNRARIVINYSTNNTPESQPLHPTVTPQFVVGGSLIGVKTDGTTNDTRAAGLDCVRCGATQSVSFPSLEDQQAIAADAGTARGTSAPTDAGARADASVPDASVPADAGTTASACAQGEGRVCSLADPFVEPLSWQAVYEGPIPGTRGGRGRLLGPDDDGNQSGVLELVGDTPFCAAGVLGDDELPKAGDQLQITAPLPSDKLRLLTESGGLTPVEADLCNALVSARDNDNVAIAFYIRRAFADRLQLNESLIKSSSKRPNATWQQVQKCFANESLTYQVHTTGTFVVQGSGTVGFLHRVIEDESTHRCRNDPAKDPRHSGRARPDVVFDNGLIAFKPLRGNFDPLTILQLVSATNTPKLVLNASDIGGTSPLRGVMPVDVRYNPGDQNLYVVDIALRGLMPVSLDPMSTVQSISIQ